MTECPDCGAEMEAEGWSGDVRSFKGGVVGIDVSVDVCPECGLVIDDMGNVARPEDRGPPEDQ